jgi:peptidoglycan/xylan/chitin deacetylase (PgdA/CDA1 family)
MYHRIGTTKSDIWQLSVEAKNFEAHLHHLKKNESVISLPTLVQQVREKKIKKRAIAITFDDGYVDNFTLAKPLLEKYGLPATFFITSKNINKPEEFWWDKLEHILLHSPELPRIFRLEGGNSDIVFDLQDEAFLSEDMRDIHRKYQAFGKGTRRAELYCKIWEKLSPLTAVRQELIMEEISQWAGKTENREAYQCMTEENIETLANAKLFQTGVHTVSHPALSYHSKDIQLAEIENNKKFVESVTHREANCIAYPSGKYNSDTLEIVRNLKFEGGVTTNEKTISHKSDFYRLGRFQVNDWDLPTFEKKLAKWFMYDD